MLQQQQAKVEVGTGVAGVERDHPLVQRRSFVVGTGLRAQDGEVEQRCLEVRVAREGEAVVLLGFDLVAERLADEAEVVEGEGVLRLRCQYGLVARLSLVEIARGVGLEALVEELSGVLGPTGPAAIAAGRGKADRHQCCERHEAEGSVRAPGRRCHGHAVCERPGRWWGMPPGGRPATVVSGEVDSARHARGRACGEDEHEPSQPWGCC